MSKTTSSIASNLHLDYGSIKYVTYTKIITTYISKLLCHFRISAIGRIESCEATAVICSKQRKTETLTTIGIMRRLRHRLAFLTYVQYTLISCLLLTLTIARDPAVSASSSNGEVRRIPLNVNSNNNHGKNHNVTSPSKEIILAERKREKRKRSKKKKKLQPWSPKVRSVDDILASLDNAENSNKQSTDAQKIKKRSFSKEKRNALSSIKLFLQSLFDPLCGGRLLKEDIHFGSTAADAGVFGR